MSEIKLNRDKNSVVEYEVSRFVSVRRIFCCLEIFLGDIAFSSSIKRYSRLEDVFCSRRRREVRFNVTIQRIVARLDLSRSGIECSACSKVLVSCRLESISQIGSVVV